MNQQPKKTISAQKGTQANPQSAPNTAHPTTSPAPQNKTPTQQSQEPSTQSETQKSPKPQPPSSNLWLKRWLHTFFFSIVLTLLFIGYQYIKRPSFSLRTLNLAVADTSIILIGLSLALSGITYFWNFADRYLVYRKNLGVTGFLFALIHSVITFYSMGKLATIIDFVMQANPSFLFGLMAILVLLFLTIISNTTSARIFGNVWWRRLLRLGYLALFFGLIHFSFMRYDNWLEWFQEPEGLPDTSLLLIFFGIFVFLLRIILEISLRLKKSAEANNTNNNHTNQQK